ncbi:MAG TPA: hypothetical protein VEZ14_14820 [Dehalococcoidia bacterium]|nr:hypothetical protein [Dehalococcoidia bacterium]
MEIVTLERGRTRASIAPEAGGRLLQLEIEDRGRWLRLLRAPRDRERALAEPTRWGSFPMAPWPNRIDGGRFVWRGRVYEVPVQHGRHALHGRGCFQPWTVERASATACRIAVTFDAGWPFGGGAVQEFRMLDDGIALRMEIHADGEAFPAGCGWHPWFWRDVRPGHDVRLLVDAERWYETDDEIPTGWLKAALGEHDLRRYAALGSRRLDACYRAPRGRLRIGWGDVELTMEQSPNATHAVVYTPPEAVCVEPQTCAIDAFNLEAQGIAGAGMAVVAPGHPLVATTTWRWRIGR